MLYHWIKRQFIRAVKKPQLFSKPKSTAGDVDIKYTLITDQPAPKKIFTPRSRE